MDWRGEELGVENHVDPVDGRDSSVAVSSQNLLVFDLLGRALMSRQILRRSSFFSSPKTFFSDSVVGG